MHLLTATVAGTDEPAREASRDEELLVRQIDAYLASAVKAIVEQSERAAHRRRDVPRPWLVSDRRPRL
jgi:hypothetical protein